MHIYTVVTLYTLLYLIIHVIGMCDYNKVPYILIAIHTNIKFCMHAISRLCRVVDTLCFKQPFDVFNKGPSLPDLQLGPPVTKQWVHLNNN